MIYTAPHNVTDQGKLESMINHLSNGGELPPIVVCGDQAYSGSHRLAAWAHMGIEADVIELDDDDYCLIMANLDLDPSTDDVYDFDIFVNAAQDLGLI